MIAGIADGESEFAGFLPHMMYRTESQQWKFYTTPGPGEVGHEMWDNEVFRPSIGGTTHVLSNISFTIDVNR
jgi:hypothetical protein